MEDNLIGKTIGGKYRIIEKIGEGGMATVYKAHHLLFDDYVAFKVLRIPHADNKAFSTRFKQEIHSAYRLRNHSGIATILDADEIEGIKFIVTDYIDGCSLEKVVEKYKALQSNVVNRITKEVCKALNYAHKHNIIHRDIKPSNILLDKEGKVFLSDFGISKAVSEVSVTKPGISIGSPRYMSPEQASPGKYNYKLDHRSDIYSLGIVLYEMLTGQVPFDTESSPLAILAMHVEEKPVPPIEVKDDIPPVLNAIVLKCLEKNSEARYQTVQELLSEIPSLSRSSSYHALKRLRFMVDQVIKEEEKEKIVLPLPPLVPEETKSITGVIEGSEERWEKGEIRAKAPLHATIPEILMSEEEFEDEVAEQLPLLDVERRRKRIANWILAIALCAFVVSLGYLIYWRVLITGITSVPYYWKDFGKALRESASLPWSERLATIAIAGFNLPFLGLLFTGFAFLLFSLSTGLSQYSAKLRSWARVSLALVLIILSLFPAILTLLLSFNIPFLRIAQSSPTSWLLVAFLLTLWGLLILGIGHRFRNLLPGISTWLKRFPASLLGLIQRLLPRRAETSPVSFDTVIYVEPQKESGDENREA